MPEFAITFGQEYGSPLYGAKPHPTLGIYSAKDGYLIVEAETRHEAREKTFAAIGEHWSFDYESVEELDPDGNGWYVRGEIARIDAAGNLVVHESQLLDWGGTGGPFHEDPDATPMSGESAVRYRSIEES